MTYGSDSKPGVHVTLITKNNNLISQNMGIGPILMLLNGRTATTCLLFNIFFAHGRSKSGFDILALPLHAGPTQVWDDIPMKGPEVRTAGRSSHPLIFTI